MEQRIIALKWWNNMTFEEQYFTVVTFKPLVVGYPFRSPDTLTGREIEALYHAQQKLCAQQ